MLFSKVENAIIYIYIWGSLLRYLCVVDMFYDYFLLIYVSYIFAAANVGQQQYRQGILIIFILFWNGCTQWMHHW